MVAGGLKRARSTLAGRRPGGHPPLPDSPAERRVVAAFVAAFERCDVPALVQLLTDDAWFTMPPLPEEYQGHDAIARFFTEVGFAHGTRRFRLVATRANGQPAFGRYLRDPNAGIAHAHGLTVLTLDRDHIAQLAPVLDTVIFPRFRPAPHPARLRTTSGSEPRHGGEPRAGMRDDRSTSHRPTHSHAADRAPAGGARYADRLTSSDTCASWCPTSDLAWPGFLWTGGCSEPKTGC